MKNHFVMSYHGNKRQEVERIYHDIGERLDMYDMETIVEPFCGSSALSYYISTLHPMEFKYVLNDNNPHLIALYKILRSKEDTATFVADVLAVLDGINKEQYRYITKEEDTLIGWYIKNKVFNFRVGLFPSDPYVIARFIIQIKNIETCPILNFLRTEDITFTNDDATAVMDEYIQDPTAFIFLDPPYMKTYNNIYHSPTLGIYDYLKENNINNAVAHVFVSLEDIPEVRALFATNHFYGGYKKRYEVSCKKTSHVLIGRA